MGDPYTQPIMMRLKSDLYDVMMAATSGELDEVDAVVHGLGVRRERPVADLDRVLARRQPQFLGRRREDALLAVDVDLTPGIDREHDAPRRLGRPSFP